MEHQNVSKFPFYGITGICIGLVVGSLILSGPGMASQLLFVVFAVAVISYLQNNPVGGGWIIRHFVFAVSFVLMAYRIIYPDNMSSPRTAFIDSPSAFVEISTLLAHVSILLIYYILAIAVVSTWIAATWPRSITTLFGRR